MKPPTWGCVALIALVIVVCAIVVVQGCMGIAWPDGYQAASTP